MTHEELTERAARWLRNTQKCSVVFRELATAAPETPDAIGWRSAGMLSILVECKVSRSDFHANKSKRAACAGRLRYFLTPPGLLAAEDLSDGWGLLEFDGKRVRLIHEADDRGVDQLRLMREMTMLFSAVRRAELGCWPPQKSAVTGGESECAA